MDKLSIIVPVFNEEEIINHSASVFLDKLDELIKQNKISDDSCVVFVDDGSKDSTWKKIYSLSKENKNITGIKLSRNFSQQSALLAGLFNIKSDMYISIDVDLQDDVNVMDEMINAYKDGSDIVYGVRDQRKTDSFFKKHTAQLFYKFMNLIGVEIVYNHSYYRLMSKRAVESLKEFKEVNMFLRGIIPLLGYKTSQVFYNRTKRIHGQSKYSFRKLLSIAWEGITSFSVMPLKLISFIGFMFFILSFGMGIWALYMKFFTTTAVPGWASTVLPIYFIGGIQLLSLGVLGEYIGKIYKESKARPMFFIEEIV